MLEQELWTRLKNGDQNALKSIYDQHYSNLCQYGLRLVTHTDIVEDAIQDVFVELWKYKSNLSETDSIKSYLFVCIKRKIIKLVKDYQKHSSNEEIEEYFDAGYFEDSLISSEIVEEQNSKLKQAVSKLSKRQQEVLYLKFEEGLDYEQISKIMDLKYQSVRNLVSTAIIKIKEHLTILSVIIFYFISTNLLNFTLNYISNDYRMIGK